MWSNYLKTWNFQSSLLSTPYTEPWQLHFLLGEAFQKGSKILIEADTTPLWSIVPKPIQLPNSTFSSPKHISSYKVSFISSAISQLLDYIYEIHFVYLVPSKQSHKVVNMMMRNSVYNLSVVFNQFHHHMSSIQTYFSLKSNSYSYACYKINGDYTEGDQLHSWNQCYVSLMLLLPMCGF